MGSDSSTAAKAANPDELAHKLALLCISRQAMQQWVSRESAKEDTGQRHWYKKAKQALKGVEMEIEEATLAYQDALLENVRFNLQYHREVLALKANQEK